MKVKPRHPRRARRLAAIRRADALLGQAVTGLEIIQEALPDDGIAQIVMDRIDTARGTLDALRRRGDEP